MAEDKIRVEDVIEDEKLVAAINSVTKELIQLGKELTNIKNTASSAKNSLNDINRINIEAQKATNKATLENARFEAQMKKVAVSLQATELRQKKVNDATDAYGNKVKKATTDTNTWSRALDSFQTKFNSIGNIIGGLVTNAMNAFLN